MNMLDVNCVHYQLVRRRPTARCYVLLIVQIEKLFLSLDGRSRLSHPATACNYYITYYNLLPIHILIILYIFNIIYYVSKHKLTTITHLVHLRPWRLFFFLFIQVIKILEARVYCFHTFFEFISKVEYSRKSTDNPIISMITQKFN